MKSSRKSRRRRSGPMSIVASESRRRPRPGSPAGGTGDRRSPSLGSGRSESAMTARSMARSGRRYPGRRGGAFEDSARRARRGGDRRVHAGRGRGGDADAASRGQGGPAVVRGRLRARRLPHRVAHVAEPPGHGADRPARAVRLRGLPGLDRRPGPHVHPALDVGASPRPPPRRGPLHEPDAVGAHRAGARARRQAEVRPDAVRRDVLRPPPHAASPRHATAASTSR